MPADLAGTIYITLTGLTAMHAIIFLQFLNAVAEITNLTHRI